MVGGEEKGQGGERENTGVEVMAAVVVGKVGVGWGVTLSTLLDTTTVVLH